ncbi:MAG: allantoicase [Ignavibacteria bacterium]|nr:allantoicase [Ignavibacteria bacterium]
MDTTGLTATFSGLIDLASECVGGKALLASDEFFAPKENLLKPGRGMFIPDKYTDRGKWMDGWETRRKRTAGHDWCIIRLGLSGMIKGVDIDTNHFIGNNPLYASIEACTISADRAAKSLGGANTEWVEVLQKSPLRPGAQNLFSVSDVQTFTHIRLNIFPDGGVARLRIYGDVVPDWSSVKKTTLIDLAAVTNGGRVVAASDMFFGAKENLIMPGRAATMGDGWETKRRRGPGHDWAIIRLGRAGVVKKIEVDTNHFKGNYPDQCSLDACYEPHTMIDSLTAHLTQWKELLPKTKLRAHRRHFFEKELHEVGSVTHVRLNIFPDGGISRLRVWGVLKR